MKVEERRGLAEALLAAVFEERGDASAFSPDEIEFLHSALTRWIGFMDEVVERAERMKDLVPSWVDWRKEIGEIVAREFAESRNENFARILKGIADQKRPGLLRSIVDEAWLLMEEAIRRRR